VEGGGRGGNGAGALHFMRAGRLVQGNVRSSLLGLSHCTALLSAAGGSLSLTLSVLTLCIPFVRL
jgi:hypothetical protein